MYVADYKALWCCNLIFKVPLLWDGNIPTLPLLISQSSQNITIKPWFMKLDALHFLQDIVEVSSSQVSDIYQTSVAITMVSKTSPTWDPLSVILEVSTCRICIIRMYGFSVCFQKESITVGKSFSNTPLRIVSMKIFNTRASQYIFHFTQVSHTLKSSLLMQHCPSAQFSYCTVSFTMEKLTF